MWNSFPAEMVIRADGSLSRNWWEIQKYSHTEESWAATGLVIPMNHRVALRRRSRVRLNIISASE